MFVCVCVCVCVCVFVCVCVRVCVCVCVDITAGYDTPSQEQALGGGWDLYQRTRMHTQSIAFVDMMRVEFCAHVIIAILAQDV